ncbi:MAG: GNAT family N-acetyltransferase [Actinomycetota bacterium]|nr:GNAT family N-acetyltransferase [Actinomycetota bacterium]
MELRDGDIELRPWKLDDVPAIVAACNDAEILHRIPVIPRPYTEADACAFVRREVPGVGPHQFASGLAPARTSETRRQRDSKEKRIRRGGCVALTIPGLLSELGYRQPPASPEARTQSTVSQVCRQQT